MASDNIHAHGTLGKVLGGIFAVALLLGGLVVFSGIGHPGALQAARPKAPVPCIVDGLLDADEVDVAAKVPGRLSELLVREGDEVQAGQLVAVVEAEELDAKQEQATAGWHAAQVQAQQGQLAANLQSATSSDQIQQARAGVQGAQATLEMARQHARALDTGARPEEIGQAQQAVNAAQAVFATAEKTQQRVQALAHEGVVAQQKADEAEMAYQSAQAQLLAAQDKLALVKAGARDEEKAAAHAQVRQAEAGVAAAQQALQLALDGEEQVALRAKDVEAAHDKVCASLGAMHEVAAYQRQTKIVSPIRGRVSQRMSLAGEIVAPGYAILSVVPTDHYWVDVYVDETQFAGRQVGDPVQVEFPALGRTLPGAISQVLPAADFATKRANNERGDYDTRAVHLHITLSETPNNLARGLTARVHFDAVGGQ